MQFSTFFKLNQYLLVPVISMHDEKQSNSPERDDYALFCGNWPKLVVGTCSVAIQGSK